MMKNNLLLILVLFSLCNITYSQSIQSNSKKFTGSSQFRNNDGTFTYELTTSAKATRVTSSPGSVVLSPKESQMKITSFSFKGIEASSLGTISFPISVDANRLDFIDLVVSFEYKGNSFNANLNQMSQITIQNWSSAMKQLKLDCDPNFNYSCIPSANDFKNIRLVLNDASIPRGTYSRFAETDKIIDAINQHIISQNQSSDNNLQGENNSNSNSNNQSSNASNQQRTYQKKTTKQNENASGMKTVEEIRADYQEFVIASNQAEAQMSNGDYLGAASTYANAGRELETYGALGGHVVTQFTSLLANNRQVKIDNITYNLNNDLKDYDELTIELSKELNKMNYDKFIKKERSLRNLEDKLIINTIWLAKKDSEEYLTLLKKLRQNQIDRARLIVSVNTKRIIGLIGTEKFLSEYLEIQSSEYNNLASHTAQSFNYNNVEHSKRLYNSINAAQINRVENLLKYNKANNVFNNRWIEAIVYITSNYNNKEFEQRTIETFVTLNKEERKYFVYITMQYDALDSHGYFPYFGLNMDEKYKKYTGDRDYKKLLILIDKGFNYYADMSSIFPENKKEMPFYKYLKKSSGKFIGFSGIDYFKDKDKEVRNTVSNLIKKDEKKTGKKQEMLFEERKDCYTVDCNDRTMFNLSQFKKHIQELLKKNDLEEYNNKISSLFSNSLLRGQDFYNIGVTLQEQNKVKDAKKMYQKSLDIYPNNENALINISVIVLNKDNEIVNEMNSLGTTTTENMKYDQLVSKRLSMYKEALLYLEKAQKINPNNTQVNETISAINKVLKK